MNQLTQYVIALTNLYGMIHKGKVLEIYNDQNEESISIHDVEKILVNPQEELKETFIHSHQDYFVHEVIMDNDEFSLMLRKKADKPYYVPEKDELLKYVDDFYFEESKQYKALLNYLKKNFFKPGDEKAEWLAENIQGMCEFRVNMQIILDTFNDRGLSFKDMNFQIILGFGRTTGILLTKSLKSLKSQT